MTCDVIRQGRTAMAKAGWSDEEILALENEVELAKRKAESTAASMGLTRAQQQELMARAENEAIKVAHDREHQRLADAAREIERLAEFRKANPNVHFGAAHVLDSMNRSKA